jgi:hypothetical protein
MFCVVLCICFRGDGIGMRAWVYPACRGGGGARFHGLRSRWRGRALFRAGDVQGRGYEKPGT